MNWEAAPKNPFYPPSWMKQIRQNRQEFMDDYLSPFPKRTPSPIDIDVSGLLEDLERIRKEVGMPENFSFNSGRFDIIIQSFLPDGQIVKLPEEKTRGRHLTMFPQRNTTLYMNSATAYKFFFMMFDFDVALDCCERIALQEVDKVIEKYTEDNIKSAWKSSLNDFVLDNKPLVTRAMLDGGLAHFAYPY